MFLNLFSTLLALLLGMMALTVPLQAQSSVTPTVTASMGDVGGKRHGQKVADGQTKHYYVAAEPVMWDYAPEGDDPVCGKPLPPPIQNHQAVAKLRYVQYTDASFTTRCLEEPRLGILGPVLRGVVGETLLVTFCNRTPQPLSMHPHGVSYDKDSEGAWYQPAPGLGAAVGPGATFTYVWHLDESSGPSADEPSSKAWLYHSHASGEGEVNRGLVGFIIVTDPKRARADGTPEDVDREMAALFLIFDESGLDGDALEALEYAGSTEGPPPFVREYAETQQMLEAGARHSINGLVFGNLTGLEANEGERVRWYLFGLGSEEDFHTAHWHGARVREEGRRGTDVVELLPASMKVADMKADNPGSWLFHCHVAEHMLEGMYARHVIHTKDKPEAPKARAFLGLNEEQRSLELRHAELLDEKTLRLAGRVTVFDAFTVFNQPFDVQVGGSSVTFNPDRSGTARNSQGVFRVRNVSPFGVVHGGVLEFEVTLAAPPEILPKLGTSVAISFKVGKAQHEATAPLTQAK